jgi:hypothetical protein
MQESDWPSADSPHADRTSPSNDGDADVSVASAPSSTTIASSSLSIFSHTASAEKAEHTSEEGGTAASHFALSHSVPPASSPSTLPPQRRTSLDVLSNSHKQVPLPTTASGEAITLHGSPKKTAVPAAASAASHPTHDSAPTFPALPIALVAPSPAGAERVEPPAFRFTPVEEHSEETEGEDDDERDVSRQLNQPSLPTENAFVSDAKGSSKTIPALTAVGELSPAQESSSAHCSGHELQSSHASVYQGNESAPLRTRATMASAPAEGSAHDTFSGSSAAHHKKDGTSNNSDSKTATSVHNSPSRHLASLDSARGREDEEEPAKLTCGVGHEADAKYATVDVSSFADHGKEEEERWNDSKEADQGDVDVGATSTTTKTIMQPPVVGRRGDSGGEGHEEGARQSLLLLSSPSPASSSPHRHRLQLSTAAPPLLSVDAPVATHTLEVSSTRSSPPPSSSPSSPSLSPSQGAHSICAETAGRHIKGCGSGSGGKGRRAAQEASPPPRSRRLVRRGSWSTPLFSSSEDEDTRHNSADAPASSPPQLILSSSTTAQTKKGREEEAEEERVVGETVVVPVVRSSPASAVTPISNVEESPHVPRQASGGTASAPSSQMPTGGVAPSPPQAAAASSTVPALLPLSASEEVAAMSTPSADSVGVREPERPSVITATDASAAVEHPPTLSPPAAPLTSNDDDRHHQLNTSPPPPQAPIRISATLSSLESGERQRETASSVLSALEEVQQSESPLAFASFPAALQAPMQGNHAVAGGAAVADAAPQTSSTPPSPAPTAAESGEAAAAPLERLTAGDLEPSSLPVAAFRLPRTATNTPLRESAVAAALSGRLLPPRLSIANSVDTSSLPAANSWTLESAGVAGPRLSMSGFPVNSLGGQSPLAMAQFANRGTVSTDGSYHGNDDRMGRRGTHDSPSSSYSSYSYYSYSGSYTSYSTSSWTGSPHTPAPATSRAAAAGGAGRTTAANAQGSTSFSSSQHQQELSVTRVGPANGLAGGGERCVVALTAYEEVAADQRKGTSSTGTGTSGGKLKFLRCLFKKPATAQQRMWRTEGHVVHDGDMAHAPSAPLPCSDRHHAEGETALVENGGWHTPHPGSRAGPASVTAAAVDGRDDEEEDASSSPDVGTVTETGRDRDRRRVLSEEGNGEENAGDARWESEVAEQQQQQEGEGMNAAGADALEGSATAAAAAPTTTSATQLVKEEEQGDALPESSQPFEGDKGNTEDASAEAVPPAPTGSLTVTAHTPLLPPSSVGGDDGGAGATPSSLPKPTTTTPARAPSVESSEHRNTREGEVVDVEAAEAALRPSALSSSADLSEDAALFFAAGQYGSAVRVTASEAEDATVSPASPVDEANDTQQMDLQEEEANRVALANLVQDEEGSATLHPAEGMPPPPSSLSQDEPPPEPLRAFFVYTEELPHYHAWDAEPPVVHSDADDDDECNHTHQHAKSEEVTLEARLQVEAEMAAAAAQSALQDALFDMAAHPPRQCLFVEVHGLQQLCRAMLCPHLAKSTGAAPLPAMPGCEPLPNSERAAMIWRGDDGNANAGHSASRLNGVVTVMGAAAAAEEDPEWAEVRLAVYSNDRQHLVAAGSIFKLPANAAALQRCQSLRNTNQHTAHGGEGFSRDSWSDVLVYQVEEVDHPRPTEHNKAPAAGGTEGRRKIAATSLSAQNMKDGEPMLSAAASSRCLSVSETSSAFNAAALYVQLEKRRERWVPVEAAEAPAGLATSFSRAIHQPRAGEKGGRSGSDTDSSVDWTTDSEGDDAAVTAPIAVFAAVSCLSSDSPPTGRHVRVHHQAEEEEQQQQQQQHEAPSLGGILYGEGTGALHKEAESAAVAEEGQPHPHQLRLEEYWGVLAVSSPLPMAQLRGLADDASSFTTQMTVPASALDSWSGVVRGQQLALPCRVRWAVEPPPTLPLQGNSAQQEKSASTGPTWSALGNAIAQYESECRGLGSMSLPGSSVERMNDEATGQSGRQQEASAPPLTVLWDTIHSPATAAATLRGEVEDEARGTTTAAARCLRQPQLLRVRAGLLDGRAPSANVGARLQRPAVCSVVMRCCTAVLLPHDTPLVCRPATAHTAAPPGLSSTYCVPTVLSVTGGLDGVVGCTTTAPTMAAAHECFRCRTPVMRYDFDFHALLTRDEAPSLLLTVESAVTSSHVFGFAEYRPFEYAAWTQDTAGQRSRCNSRGTNALCSVTEDVWLPMFAPVETAVTAAEAQERRQQSQTSSTRAGEEAAGDGPAYNTVGGGVVLTGWLHCDVEVVFLGSLSEAAVQRLWNGATHSLVSLETAAAVAAADGQPLNPNDNGSYGVVGSMGGEDSVVDLCVVEAAGLRPLTMRFGAPLPPAPLSWEARGGGVCGGHERTADAPRCTRVYCEVVTVQHSDVASSPSRPQLDERVGRGGSDNGVCYPARAYGSSPSPQSRSAVADTHSFSRGSAGVWSASASGRGGDRDERSTASGFPESAGAGLSALPVTAAVADTNRPRWQHTFRCGMASLRSMCLRVFDRAVTARSRGDDAADGAPPSRSVLLGVATVSPWMLRRIVASVSAGPLCCEGSAWLPLLWTPSMSSSSSHKTDSETDGRQSGLHRGDNGRRSLPPLSPAVSNGYVLVQWRRATLAATAALVVVPPPLPAQSCLVGTAGCDAILQRRLSHVSLTFRCQRHAASKSLRRLLAGEARRKTNTPTRGGGTGALGDCTEWYDGAALPPPPHSHRLNWMSPQLAPWLSVHRLRLQWPWLQHILTMCGGHVRMRISYLTANDEQRMVDQFLLVPLSQVRRRGNGSVGASNHAASLRHARLRRSRAAPASNKDRDEDGSFAVVSAASLSLDTFHRMAASTTPMETTFCLPATRCVFFQLWWYPNSTAFPATNAETATAAAACPPRLVGRGSWHFPATDVDVSDLDDATVDSSRDDASESVLQSASASPALHLFFTPHEADVHLSAVRSVAVPYHVEGGVLRWQLSSVPRLTCEAWGRAKDVADGGQTSAAQRWRWPDVGTSATVHMQVHHLLWLRRSDEAAVAAATGNMQVVVEEEERECSVESLLRPSAMASVADERCWTAPGDAPNGVVPRVPYALACNTHPFIAGGDGDDDAWPEVRSSASPSLRGASPATTACCGCRAERGGEARRDWTAMSHVHSGDDDVSLASPAVELRWAPRRFRWFKDDAPTVRLWVLSAESSGSGSGTNGNDGVQQTRKERVWGAVRLPRLAALTANDGMLWLPLFRTYAAPPSQDENGVSSPAPPSPLPPPACDGLDSPASTSLCETAATTESMGVSAAGAACTNAAVTVEHVGFAAVSYTHNFVQVGPTAGVARNEEAQEEDHHGSVCAVRTSTSRLLLVQAGPLHCRDVRGAAQSSAEVAKVDAERLAATEEEGRRQLRCQPSPSLLAPTDAQQQERGEHAAASHSSDDFTASSSASAATPHQPQSSDTPSFTAAADGSCSAAEVLLGFESYRTTMWVDKATAVPPHCSDAPPHDKREGDETAAQQPIVVLPWRDASGCGSDSREVRLQTQLRSRAGGSVTAGGTFNVVRHPGGGPGCDVNGGAQWVPLIARHRSTKIISGVSTADAAPMEGNVVVGKLLVRWRVLDPPSTRTRQGGAARCAPEELWLHRLIGQYCGGAGAGCTYAVLHGPAATATEVPPSSVANTNAVTNAAAAVGSVDGRLAKRGGHSSGVAGRVRAWAASLSSVASPFPESLQTFKVFDMLRQIGPIHHPCVYLVIDHVRLQCGSAHLRAWRELLTPQPNIISGNCTGTLYFRLEVQMAWPAEWSATWLRTIPFGVLPSLEGAARTCNAVAAVDKNSGEPSPQAHTSTIEMDVVEGALVDLAAPAHGTAAAADPTAALTLRCACTPLCLPLPSSQHIQHALGEPGLAARFQLSFRLSVIRGTAAANVKQLEVGREPPAAPEEVAEAGGGVALACVGTGRTPLSFPQCAEHGITSLRVSQTWSKRCKNGESPATTTSASSLAVPLLLSWRAHVSDSLPQPRKTRKTADSATEGTAEADEAALSISSSTPPASAVEVTGAALPYSAAGKRKGNIGGCVDSVLVRLTVTRVEMAGVDVSLACGAAQRHRSALAPATVAVMAGTTAESEGNNDGSKDGDDGAAQVRGPSQPRGAFESAIVVLTPSFTERRASSSQQQQQQRYRWSTEVCVRAETQLVFYVGIAEAALRTARGEEMWTMSADENSANDRAAALPSVGSARTAVTADLLGKAAYTLDAVTWIRRQRQQQRQQLQSTSVCQERDTQEALLELESPTEGRWMGRLSLQVELVAASAVWQDPRDTFLSTRLSASVGSCSGLVIGDVQLTRRVEETYQALRGRVAEELERRGSVPRRLQQHVKEVRQMRRQLSSHTSRGADVCLVLCSTGDTTTESHPVMWTSQSFRLPSALALVREELVTAPVGNTRGRGDVIARATTVSAADPLLRLSQVVDSLYHEARAASAVTVKLRLVPFAPSSVNGDGDDDRDDRSILAVGHVALPLPTEVGLAQTPFYTRHLTVPLTPHPAEVTTATSLEQPDPTQKRVMVTSAAADTPATLTLTATWSVEPTRGDTYFTCLTLEVVGARFSSWAGHRNWLLRWIYTFEASASPEVEHAVDTPLQLTPSAPSAANVCSFWSGATARLPRVGTMGATLRRVELVEATPLTSRALLGSAHQSTQMSADNAYTTTRLAVQHWSVRDELQLRAMRYQAQQSDGDAWLWLHLRSSAAGGREGPRYRILLGLYTSNTVARYETQRLTQQVMRRAGRPPFATGGSHTPSRSDTRNCCLSVLSRRLPPATSLPLRAPDDVSAETLPYAAKTADMKTDNHISTSTVAAATVSGASADRGGGVVMRTIAFHCAGSALSAAGLKKGVESVTCRVVRECSRSTGGGAQNAHDTAGKGSRAVSQGQQESREVLLNVGHATRVLQTQNTPPKTGDTPVATASITFSAAALVPEARIAATWAPPDTTRRSAFFSQEALSGGAVSAHTVLQRSAQVLLRLNIPTNSTAGDSAFDSGASWTGPTDGSDRCGSMAEDVQLRVVVIVGDGDASVHYVTEPFSALSVLHATEEKAQAGLRDGDDERVRLSWTTRLSMRCTTAVAANEAQEGAAMAEVELQWGLDVAGVQPTLAVASCLSFSAVDGGHRSVSTGSRRGRKVKGALRSFHDDATSDAEDSSDAGDAALYQMEGCAAWTDFLATLRSEEQLRDEQAHLRHWRCRITAVEVEGLELPMWASRAARNSHSSGCSDRAVGLPSLLAQLNFPTKRAGRTSEDGEGGEERGPTCNEQQDCVLGVARAVAVAAVPATTDKSAALSVEDRHPAPRQCVLPCEVEASRSFSAPHAPPTFHTSFRPLSWSIALRDMMRQRRSAAARSTTEETQKPAPPPGLSLWQLLTPTTTAQRQQPQEVYALGAVQLSLLLQEGALVLTQILARWCSGACTQDERDALLSAVALYPTRWMPLTNTSAGGGAATAVEASGARVRFYYKFIYDGPQCPPPTVMPGVTRMPSPAVPIPTALADAVYCAQLDRVQLTYPILSRDSGRHSQVEGVSDTDSKEEEERAAAVAAKWLSSVVLQMCVVLERVCAEEGGDDGDASVPLQTDVMTRWTAHLAPLPITVPPKLLPVAPSPVPLPPHVVPSVPVAIPVPVPIAASGDATVTSPAPTPVSSNPTTLAPKAPAAPDAASTVGEDSDSPPRPSFLNPSRIAVVPALPTTSCFCWQPSPVTKRAAHTRVPDGAGGACTTSRTAVRIFVDVDLVHLPEPAIEPFTRDDAAMRKGEVVGHHRVYIGSTKKSALRWDTTEERLDEGWRLSAPLSVQVPVKIPLQLDDACASVQLRAGVAVCKDNEGEKATSAASSAPPPPQPLSLSAYVEFDLLAFTAPSWGLVKALQSAHQVSHERRQRTLASLQRTEARLLSAVVTTAGKDPDVMGSAVPRPAAAQTLQQLSTAFVSHPYRVLRVPPAVYRLSSFAIADVIEQSDGGYRGVGEEGGVRQAGQSLWSMVSIGVRSDGQRTTTTATALNIHGSSNPGSNGTTCHRTWLINAATGDVRIPRWHLLPSLMDAFRGERDSYGNVNDRTLRLQCQLSWWTLPAGRVLVEERARLRLEWCCIAGPCPASALAGVVGGAAVSYLSAAGNPCLWVSGGLRLTSDPPHGAPSRAHEQQMSSDVQAGTVRGGPVSAVPIPPPRVCGAASPKPSLHCRRSLLSSASPSLGTEPSAGRVTFAASSHYQLCMSHLLRCSSVSADHSHSCEGSRVASPQLPSRVSPRQQQWRVEVDVPASHVARLCHTATQLGDHRVWLLGGWSYPTTTSSTTTVLPVAEAFRERWPITQSSPLNAGLVERRRSEVRYATATATSSGAPNTGEVVLQWCAAVHCVQCLADGTPAPPVEVAAAADVEVPCMACHVAVACGSRHVAVFGGLVPGRGAPLQTTAVSATADVHCYDTVRGVWTRVPATMEAGQLWPMARYGHSCAVVPGTGGTQPHSYFVFGGATVAAAPPSRDGSEDAAPTARACGLVPPDELLWIWTPLLDARDHRLQCTWRRVRVPADLPSPLTGRFLPQLVALSAAEVMAAATSSTERRVSGKLQPTEGEGGATTAAAADAGLTSMVVCVGGGTTRAADYHNTARDVGGAAGETSERRSEVGDATSAFRRYVEPWLHGTAGGVTAVLVTAMCECPALPSAGA